MSSDMQWYLDRTAGPVKDFYDIFFQICRKHNISWGKATEKERDLVRELTDVTYELQLAKANRTPLEQEKTPAEFLATPQTNPSDAASHTRNSLQILEAYVKEITEQRTAGSDWKTYRDTYLQILRQESFRMGIIDALEMKGDTSECCIQKLMAKCSISEEEARATYERYHES